MKHDMKGFLNFCENERHPEEEYLYADSDCCAMAQYLGRREYQNMRFELEPRFEDYYVCEMAACNKPWTFGALANRLHNIIEELK